MGQCIKLLQNAIPIYFLFLLIGAILGWLCLRHVHNTDRVYVRPVLEWFGLRHVHDTDRMCVRPVLGWLCLRHVHN